MKLVQSYLTKNPCYTANKNQSGSTYVAFQKNGPQGLMLHSVGCPQPKASVFISNWNSASYSAACVHAFIDGNDGTIYQALPWNYRAWHCGSGSKGSGNNTHIGVEMCEPACIKYTSGANFTCSDTVTAKAIATRTYNAAVELFAYLCQEFKLDPTKDGVILSHSEGYSRGIASGHADPEHLWKGLGLPYTMNTFRQAVKAKMSGVTVATPTTTTPTTTSTTTSGGKVLYKVKITTTNLRIRSKAGTDGTVKGFIAPGIYTIVEESTGTGAKLWGKLLSGAGWIALDYATRL